MSEGFAHGAAAVRRLTLARDICANLKTVVVGTRLFPPGHPTVVGYFHRLQQFLSEFLEREGPLTLAVSSSGLLLDGELVLTSDGKSPLISDPIFRDGVTEITFAVETPAEELSRLTDIWSASMLAGGAETGQTFTTRCWEAEFDSIRIVSLDNFIEYLDEHAERELNDLLQVIEEERSRGPEIPVTERPRLGPSEIPRLRSSGLLEIQAADLDPRGAIPALQALTPAEARALVEEAESERSKQSLPAITALAFAGLDAAGSERTEIVTALGSIFVSIARAAGLDQVLETVDQFVEAARTDSDGPHRRFEALPLVLDGLGTQTLLSLCVAAVTGPKLDSAVDRILGFLQPGAAPAFLDALASAPQATAEILLPRFLSLQPQPGVLRIRIARVPALLAQPLLDFAKTFPEGDQIEIYVAAIAHADPGIRHLAAGRVPREVLLKFPESLYPLVNDSDANLRQLAVSVLLSSKDVSAVPYLVQMLDRADLDLAERRRVIRSLGSLPTRESISALRNEFRTQMNPETAASCAMALGRAGDEISRTALEQVVAKRTHPELKAACANALRMLDSRRTAGGTQPGQEKG